MRLAKTLLLFLCILFAVNAFAQPQKGAFYFGGNLNGRLNNGYNIPDPFIYSFLSNQQAGIFINRFTAVSLNTGLSKIKYIYHAYYWDELVENSYLVGPKLSFYLRLNNSLYFAINSSALYKYSHSFSNHRNFKSEFLQFSIGPEALFFVAPGVAITTEVNYNSFQQISQCSKPSYDLKYGNLSLFIGTKFFINKKKSND